MYTDLMIDLEYLAGAENAVIAQISAIPFDITNGYYQGMENNNPTDAFNAFPCLQGQLDGGRVIDADTMSWWINQAVIQAHQPAWLDDPTGELDDAMEDLFAWGMERFDWQATRIWSHIGEDMYKLASACRDASMPVFWRRSKLEHLQTLRRLAKVKASQDERDRIDGYRDLKTHDAVDDCRVQIQYAHLCWEILMG